MLEKFKNFEFGRCPRFNCEGQACLPVGTSDVPGQSTVKVFCPKCEVSTRAGEWRRHTALRGLGPVTGEVVGDALTRRSAVLGLTAGHLLPAVRVPVQH
jgi:hypothetical protein